MPKKMENTNSAASLRLKRHEQLKKRMTKTSHRVKRYISNKTNWLKLTHSYIRQFKLIPKTELKSIQAEALARDRNLSEVIPRVRKEVAKKILYTLPKRLCLERDSRVARKIKLLLILRSNMNICAQNELTGDIDNQKE